MGLVKLVDEKFRGFFSFHGQNIHAEGFRFFGDFSANTAQSQDADGFIVHLITGYSLLKMRRLIFSATRQAAGERKHHGQNVLGNGNAVNAARVGKQALAATHFGKG